jgi:beta-phosphoglucomutase-like phosphatase (HAD superfamily)
VVRGDEGEGDKVLSSLLEEKEEEEEEVEEEEVEEEEEDSALIPGAPALEAKMPQNMCLASRSSERV